MNDPAYLYVVLAGLLCGCASDTDSPRSVTPRDTDLRTELMQLDRDFAADVAEGGLESWMSYMAPDAARLVLGRKAVRGQDSIRAADAPLFGPDIDLTWEPAWTPNRLTDAGRQAMGLTSRTG